MAHSKMSPKRKVNVRGQKHSLAYINDREKRLLRKAGGSGKPGPNGIPTYFDVGEGWGGYDSTESRGGVSAAETAGGAGDPDAGRDDGGTYSDDQTGRDTSGDEQRAEMARSSTLPSQFLADKVADRKDPVTGMMKYSPVGAIANKIAKFTRGQIEKQLRAGGTPIFNKDREIMGVMHDGPFGGRFGKVYTGRTMDPDQYDGPAEFADQVTMDLGGGESDDVRTGAKKKILPKDVIDGKLPDAPKAGDGDDTERRSKMGKESTISTTAQGLLGSAKTRNRSLMAGLIS